MTKKKDNAEKAIRDIRRAIRRQYSAEEKIRIVLEGNIAFAAPILYQSDVIKPNAPEDIYEEHTNPWGKLVNVGATLAGASHWSSFRRIFSRSIPWRSTTRSH